MNVYSTTQTDKGLRGNTLELTVGLPMSTCGCHILAIYEYEVQKVQMHEKKEEEKNKQKKRVKFPILF